MSDKPLIKKMRDFFKLDLNQPPAPKNQQQTNKQSVQADRDAAKARGRAGRKAAGGK
jgi:hypothetical protein